MDNIRFSIVVPIYNSESTIYDSLYSIFKQTFENFEVIMMDDGSTDRSSFVCREFENKDHRFHYFYQNNAGVSSARNHAIEYSKGEYLVFLDSDDTYDERYLETFDLLIRDYSDYDNFWCGFKSVNNSKITNSEIIYDPKEKVSICTRDEIMILHRKNLNVALWNKAFKRDLINRYSISMQEGLSLGEDLLFNFEYLNIGNGKIAIINLPLYNYVCFDENSLDNKYRKNLKEIYDLLDEKMFHYLLEWQVSSEQWRYYYSAVFFKQEVILRNTFNRESQESFFSKLKYNDSILTSTKFKNALNKADCYINPLYRKAYESGHYINVILLNVLLHIKKRVFA